MDPMTMMLVAGAAGKVGEKVAGGILPMATGGAQMIQGHIQRAKAKKMQPGQEDATQVSAMQEYQRRANNAMTGANISQGMRDVAQMQGAGIKALGRGGNLSQFSRLGRIQSQALNDVLAQGQQAEMGYRNMFNNMLNTVADRRMRVQSKAADAMSMRAEKNIASGTQNVMAGLTKLSGGKGETKTDTMGGGGQNFSIPGSGGANSPMPMDMSQIEAAGSSPIMGFGGMPLGI